ncbi:MAG: hypothetical protein QW191_06200 [Conexivisphaerales archaeon]
MDMNNKMVYYITKNYEYTVYQEGSISGRSRPYRRNTCQRSIREFQDTLKKKAHTPVAERFVRPLAYPFCLYINRSEFTDKGFICFSFNSVFDRDVAFAVMEEQLYLRNIDTLSEGYVSIIILKYINTILRTKESILCGKRSIKQADLAEEKRRKEALSVKGVVHVH